jgi:hypothetical protein
VGSSYLANAFASIVHIEIFFVFIQNVSERKFKFDGGGVSAVKKKKNRKRRAKQKADHNEGMGRSETFKWACSRAICKLLQKSG